MKVNVVRSLLKVVVPATPVPPAESVTAVFQGLAALMGAVATTWTCTLTGTPLAPFGGLTAATVGGAVDAVPPVVNVEVKNASELPTRSAMEGAPPNGLPS